MKLNITKITAQDLKNNKFQKLLPEFYELKKYVENSPWHLKQTVFDHIVAVYYEAENILSNKSNIAESKLKLINNYLEEYIGNQTRKSIYFLAVLLHDNAKNDTLVINEAGIAGCPGHELIGAVRVWNYQDRFGFDDVAMEAVERVVRYHGLISEMINQSIITGKTEKYYQSLKNTGGNVLGELILLMYADLLGSDLGKNDQKAFRDRILILNKFIVWFFE